jgi:hypothetical protein
MKIKVSIIANVLNGKSCSFEVGIYWLPKHYHLFQCVVNLPKEKPKTIFHPTQELEVQASSKETIATMVDPINGELPPYYNSNNSEQTKL